ncbi:redoxin domain-containing protein [Emticicia sp. 21SJ11W-3]|uniref:redoxin domain-containing protein n=1 Tax=Emticicia sp. 21SJ11W-3 TaxID=2916755 RepID=UPI0020A08A59|nr:redoxin domain-containing protein [Emticicia sp. 21SJ11W-3]UTA70006.1 redoxin domain-containing protein [Emticicia sp. 21SJ11W-3]
MSNYTPKYDPAFWDTDIQVKRNNSKLLPLLTGSNAPDITFKKDMGIWQQVSYRFNYTQATIKSIMDNKPLVISFLSGGWNNYGLKHLKLLSQAYPEILALGGNLLVIVHAMYQDVREMVQYFEIPFNVIADPHNEISEKFGLFSKDVPVWDKVSGISEEVPIPATYVLNQYANVIYHTIDEDFLHTFSATKVLGAVFAAVNRVPFVNYAA